MIPKPRPHGSASPVPFMRTACALAAASVILSAAAFYNGYPLLYPDSMDYVADGGPAAWGLLLREPISGQHRSLFYSLTILPLHWYLTPWPIVLFHGLLTACVLWLTMRIALPRSSCGRFLTGVTMLTLLTGVSGYVGYIMPDILAPLLVLGVYLLAFTHQRPTRATRAGIVAMIWLAMVSHTSHLLLAGGLLVAGTVLLRMQHWSMREVLPRMAPVAGTFAAAVFSLLLVHTWLWGTPSLTGKRPPYLMARVIADGPGRWYLQRRCPDLGLAICRYAARLPDNVADFLWAEGGLWRSLPDEVRDRLREEEMRVVLGSLSAYPWEQLRASARGLWRQLNAFGLWNYTPDPWLAARIGEVLPGSGRAYFQSRQARRALHEESFTRLQNYTLLTSILIITLSGALFWRCWTYELVALAVLVSFSILANAAITGVLSNVEDRYQARVVWLVPLVAYLMAVRWRDERNPGGETLGNPQKAESAAKREPAEARKSS